MSRIYVSSSWKNELQPELVNLLRQHGHKVYDFRHPDGRDDRNVWEEVTPPLHLDTAYQQSILTPSDYDKMLSQKEVRDRFNLCSAVTLWAFLSCRGRLYGRCWKACLCL